MKKRFIARWVGVLVLVSLSGWHAAAAAAAPGSGSDGEPVPTWESEGSQGAGGSAGEVAEPSAVPPSTPVSAADQGCRASPWCHIQGRCTAVGGQCLSQSDAECGASLWCRDFGHCRVGRDGTCGAQTDADCEQSTACRHRGLCEARQRRCGLMRPIALPEGEEEPEGPYVPKEGSTAGPNVPLLVGGIVVTSAGGVGVAWLIVELFSAWGAGATGGKVADEEEARLIGSAVLAVGGLAIGLPLLVYGARSKSGRSTSQTVPTLTVGPGAATLHWSF